jgi:two-component system sensor histidine kinase DegS
MDITGVNKIINKIIQEIGSSKEHIFDIVDNIRNEYEHLKSELYKIKADIDRIINEVDYLEKQDKIMRTKLVEVSKNFDRYNENDIKAVYEKASDVRINFITKINEEKILKERRYNLELILKKSMKNIESGEKVINQVSIALGYLQGNLLSFLEDADKNSQMFVGIRILEAQENERKRIARDLHDGPTQHLAYVIMNIDLCKNILQKDLEKGLGELENLKESVKTALREVRMILFDLKPMSLGSLSLNETIEETVKAITQDCNIHIKLRLKPINSEIEPIIQVALYRIVQEIFNNIKKHSIAKNTELKLDFGTKYLILIISDDGIGFNVEETLKRVKTKGTSYGLMGILDRVSQLQGKIEIKSLEGSGTIYTIKLPVNREVILNEKPQD